MPIADLLHLKAAVLCLDVISSLVHLESCESLVTFDMRVLKLEVTGSSRLSKDSNQVPESTALCEGAVSVFLLKLAGVQVFSCCFTSAHQEDMIDCQSGRVRSCKAAIYDHGKGKTPLIDGFTKSDTFHHHIAKDMSKTSREKEDGEYSACSNEGEEVTVISASNAIVEPDTVMVQGFNAVVAYSAVIATRWTPDAAGLAVLYWHIHGSNFGCS